MILIKVDKENKVRILSESDYRISYNVKATTEGLFCCLVINGDKVIAKHLEDKDANDLVEVENKMGKLVFTISEMLCLSVMQSNQSVICIIINPDTVRADINRVEAVDVLDYYGLLPKHSGN